MTETFLILLGAGVMLAAAISDPREVTINWLRLGGIIALALTALSIFFVLRRSEPATGRQWLLHGFLFFPILMHLVFIHFPNLSMAWFFSLVAFLMGVAVASGLVLPRPSPVALLLSSVGIAAMSGLALMDMLLGHAYLTAAKMTMRPFVRLHLALAIVTVLRAVCAMGVSMFMLQRQPIELFWDRFGIMVITRWLVGLEVPAVFIYMAWDCIRRRSTQSATGILYVAGVLIFIGELIALYLLRETRLPF